MHVCAACVSAEVACEAETVGLEVFACACLSIKGKVDVSKYTELLFIGYSIPVARLQGSDIPLAQPSPAHQSVQAGMEQQ